MLVLEHAALVHFFPPVRFPKMHTILLQFKRAQAIAAALIAAFAIVFAVYVWPTPYQYFTIHEPVVRPARVQRFTGRTELLGRWGWYTPRPTTAQELQAFDALTARR